MYELKSSHRSWLALAIFALGIFTVGTSNPSSGGNGGIITTALQATQIPHQSPEKHISRYASFSNEPVLIADLKIKGRPMQINSSVAAKEDWLDGLAFKVKNVSNKGIVLVYIELLFPETKLNGGNVIAFDIRYGADTRLQTAPENEKTLQPGDQAEFTIGDTLYKKIRRAVETRTPFENINSIQINILKVIFDDDTAWSTGSFMHRDPTDVKKWIDN